MRLRAARNCVSLLVFISMLNSDKLTFYRLTSSRRFVTRPYVARPLSIDV